MTWTRFSVRRGIAEEIGPLDGVPDHLKMELFEFINMVDQEFRDDETLRRVCRLLHFPVPYGESEVKALRHYSSDETGDTLLDVVDCILFVSEESWRWVRYLNTIFEDCGVNWVAEPSYKDSNDEVVPSRLAHRIEPEVREAMSHALDPSDQAGTELREAWQAVYGRSPNPSDAWDHAIKAVESLLCPIVMPAVQKGQIGKAIGQLKADARDHPGRWTLTLPGAERDHGVKGLLGMLDLLWANTDRHANANTVAPTLEQAAHVVLLAATLVQWLRTGALQRN